MEEKITGAPVETTEAAPVKTWSFIEERNKHVTHHTFTIKGKRFSHQAELKELSQSYKQRTDFNLDNVYAVNSYYGVTRNLVAAIILAVLAVISVIFAIVNFVNEVVAAGIALLVVGALFALFAYLAYKKITPSFVLEIQTVIPRGQLDIQNFTYGTPSVSFGKKAITPIQALVLVVLWPLGILYLLTRSKGKKYKFKMDEQTGLDIVDTIGAYLIKE